MQISWMRVVRIWTLRTFLIAALMSVAVCGQDQPTAPRPWTLDEALEQLRFYPRDAYLQYVALQLAHRDGREEEVLLQLGRRRTRVFANADGRRGSVDLFSLFSGSLAIQESLQLDAMRGDEQASPFRTQPLRNAPFQTPTSTAAVKVQDLVGPTIQSHPWEKMLGEKKPEISPLAQLVPIDFYFVEFRSVAKLLDAIETANSWGAHLFSQSSQDARTQLVDTRLKTQLVVETSELLRPFYDLVVSEIAITGSDVFVREGSDVTLLFRVRQPDVFRKQMDAFLANAEKSHPDARRSTGEIQGVSFTHVTSPDRTVHVYSAYPRPDLHIRANSRVALERVIAAYRGKSADGKQIERLGDAKEFAYIRTLMPRGAAEEDGFAYLSDPFIRRLVGPELKLTARRRMLCYNHLRMIGHASMLYRTEKGQWATSLQELHDAKCTPGMFGEGKLICPDGGKYSLSDNGLSAVCTHHGHARNLTPCCEIPVQTVSRAEAREYEGFLAGYNEYWRTFFDPIALRLQVAPKQYRLETIILPLIENSIYTGLARATSGQPEKLDDLPVPQRNILSLAMRLNKRELLTSLGLADLIPETEPAAKPQNLAEQDTDAVVQKLRELGLAMHNHHDGHRSFPTFHEFDKSGQHNRLSWRVHLLPYLGQATLYSQFRLDEPWDSEVNRKLVDRMPQIYQSRNEQLNAKGMTKFVVSTGPKSLFPDKRQRVGMANIVDGTSNTIMIVEADDEHAVIWTKPDDLEIDPGQPLKGLANRKPGGVLFLMADASVQFVRTRIAPETLVALMTRDGGERINHEEIEQIPIRISRSHSRFGVPSEIIEQLQLGELVSKGLGNQIGIHIYDAEQMFSFSIPTFFGQSLGTFRNRGLGFANDFTPWAVLIASLNSPVYLSIPVIDPSVVDLFLGRLDAYLARVLGNDSWSPFFELRQEAYRLQLANRLPARALTIEFGPLKWRLFWARIGRGLYLATQPHVLEDLATLESSAEGTNPTDPTAGGAKTEVGAAHALLRLRPQHWDRVLSSYRLGWAESNREACLQNLAPLSNISRTVAAKPTKAHADHIHDLASKVYDARFFCPDGGQYVMSADGKQVTCTVHGSKQAAHQHSAPAPDSRLGRLLEDFGDLSVTLTFLEDGLHAVMTLERK